MSPDDLLSRCFWLALRRIILKIVTSTIIGSFVTYFGVVIFGVFMEKSLYYLHSLSFVAM